MATKFKTNRDGITMPDAIEIWAVTNRDQLDLGQKQTLRRIWSRVRKSDLAQVKLDRLTAEHRAAVADLFAVEERPEVEDALRGVKVSVKRQPKAKATKAETDAPADEQSGDDDDVDAGGQAEALIDLRGAEADEVGAVEVVDAEADEVGAVEVVDAETDEVGAVDVVDAEADALAASEARTANVVKADSDQAGRDAKAKAAFRKARAERTKADRAKRAKTAGHGDRSPSRAEVSGAGKAHSKSTKGSKSRSKPTNDPKSRRGFMAEQGQAAPKSATKSATSQPKNPGENSAKPAKGKGSESGGVFARSTGTDAQADE